MHAIADFIKNSRIIRTFAKLFASGWILFLILGMLFTEEYQEYASKAQIFSQSALFSVLAVFLCYTICNVEKMVHALSVSTHKGSFLYAFFYASSLTLIFNPLDHANNEVVEFNRVIGMGILDNMDVSRRISNFQQWFLYFAVFFVLFYLFANYLHQRKKSDEAKKAEEFLDHFMILANCCLVLRSILYFHRETNTPSYDFLSMLILLIALVVQLYVFLQLDRWMSAGNWGKLGFIGAATVYSVSIILTGGVSTSRAMVLLIMWAVGMLLLCFASKRIPLSAMLSAGVLVIPALPLLTSVYIELLHILNQYGVALPEPRKYYSYLVVGVFLLWVVLGFRMKKKTIAIKNWKLWAFPIFVAGIACLSKQIPLASVYHVHLFESANYGVLINDFLSFGKIPNVEHYGGHMMTAVWEGILYALLNQDFAGAFVSPYAGILDVVQILLFYYLVKSCWNEELALLTTLFFPFYSAWVYFGLGIMICLLAVMYIRKNTYLRAAFLWAGFIWCALYRLDLGFAFGLAAIAALAIYIAVTRNWKAIKQLLLTLAGWGITGVALWCGLCLAKGIHPVNRLLEFLYVNMSNQNWAYSGLGNTGISAFGWSYVLFPLVSIGALIYTCTSRNIRENIGTERWLMLMMLGFSYFFNFSRGLVRHSLMEMITYVIFVSGYVFLAVFISCYKNNRKLFLPVFLALMLCDSLLLSNLNFSASTVAEDSVTKTDSVIRNWDQLSEFETPVQRVILSQETQKYAEKYKILDQLLETDETFVDFINKTSLYSILNRECPVYISQSPLQLSGEFMQEAFVEQIAGVPLVLMPVDAQDYVNSSTLDGIANAYKYYLVSEYIYQHYVPLCQYNNDYAVWCLTERYEQYKNKLEAFTATGDYEGKVLCAEGVLKSNTDLSREGAAVIITSTDIDPMLMELQQAVDLSAYAGYEILIAVQYETDTSGMMQLFYTTEAGEGYTGEKVSTVQIAQTGTAEFMVPVTEHTRLRLDIPEQSTVKINALQIDTPIKRIDWGYDGPEEVKDSLGNTIYAYANYFHNYNLKHLPRIWAEYDADTAVNNRVVVELTESSGIYQLDDTSVLSKENGNYLKISANYDGHDSNGYQNADDEYIDVTVILGSMKNDHFEEKARYTMTVQEGSHNYLIRCSADYYWYLNQIDAVQILSGNQLQDVTVSVLEGD